MCHDVTMSTLLHEIKEIRQEFEDISYALDERRIRLWCAARARTYNRKYGRGGVMAVHHATGIPRSRIYTGIKELTHEQKLDPAQVRKSGGGRKKNNRNLSRDSDHIGGVSRAVYTRRS